jgi:hypothetical protein
MNKKMAVIINDIRFEIKSEALRTTDYQRNPIKPKIYARPPIAGSMIKQYVKFKYPSVVCTVKSNSFANGNSLDVNISTKEGNPVDSDIMNDIVVFSGKFEYGKFNGMYDSYEIDKTSGMVSDKGTEIEAGVKYLSVYNRPRDW